MRLDPLQTGPWVEGEDSVHEATHAVFQVGGETPARLTAAENVYFTDDGWARIRLGLTERISTTTGLNLFSGAGLLLLQDAGVIKLVNTSTWETSDLVTGLTADARIKFYAFNDVIYWSNGTEKGRITSAGTALNWGCATAASPTLGTTAGDLPAGIYQVAATFIDSSGIEHSAGKASAITLSGTQDITATVGSLDSDAVSVKFYATKANQRSDAGLFFVKTVAVGSLPTTITDVEVSEEYLRNQFLSPPIAADIIFSYRGMLILGVDEYLLPSLGPQTHLYEIGTKQEARPSAVLAGAGLRDGFWTVTANGLYWTTGNEPKNWFTSPKVDDRKYAAGSLIVPGYYIPKLRVNQNIALFVSEDGLIAGMPDGSIYPMTLDRMRLTVTGMRASIAMYKVANDRLFSFSLTEA